MTSNDGKRAGETGTVGEVVDGRYRIVGLLGIGAMGCVYRAEQIAGGDTLAIKLLHPELGKVEEIARRFEREAMATARVGGDHCVQILDFGALADGRLYLAMELLRGASLADLIEREGRMEPARALRIAGQILAGLERAHAAGVVHRDLKPENIVLAERDGGEPVATILDFGLAKLVGDGAIGQEVLTRAGFAMGTPTYMAPEWVTRQAFDERGDLYSLSVLLYELLTGRPPFRAPERHEVLVMHAAEPVPSVADTAPDAGITEGVEALVLWGLEKQPEQRVATATAYRELVELLLEDPDAPAKQVRPPAGQGAPGGQVAAGEGGTALMFGLRRDGPDSGAISPDEAVQAAPSASAPVPTPAPPPRPLPPVPPPAGALGPTAGRWSRWQIAALGGAITVVAAIALVASITGTDRFGPDARLRALSEAGLEVGGFGPLATAELGGECAAGAVSGIPVILCAYDDAGAAARARDIVDMRGRVITSGPLLMILRPAPRVDPQGAIADAIVAAFAATGEEPPEPAKPRP